MGETYLSREGYEKLRLQLMDLKTLKAQLSKEIGEAMEQGDLRENAGYTAAKERQAEILRRMGEIETKLQSARLIEEIQGPKDEVRIGAKVTLVLEGDADEFVYTLVGPEESDPSRGRISVQSPLAQGLLGKKVGQEATLSLPGGQKRFRLLRVDY